MKTIYKLKKGKLQYVVIGLVLASISFLQLTAVTTSVASRLSNEPTTVSVVSVPVRKEVYVPTHITISKVGIDLAVVSVELKNGTWEVNDGVANYAVETGKILSTSGNVGIYGHDRANAFTRIKELQKGDTIEVSASGQKAIYAVSTVGVTDPSNVEVFAQTEEPTLTLVTCDGIFSQQRYIVKAILERIEEVK